MDNHKGFIEDLKKRLQEPLPGEAAQFEMAPIGRLILNNELIIKRQAQQSAVLILLYPFENELHTVLIKRAAYDGVHSGQMAFPGGKKDKTDNSLQETATRETFEEIGVPIDQINVIGKLTDVYISPSNHIVSPFIGYVRSSPVFKANKREVDSVLKVVLSTLNNKEIKGLKEIQQSNGIKIKTPYYEVEGFTIWGATAMMISELNVLTADVISF